MSKSETDVFNLYQNTFAPIYGDLLVVSGKKPPELLEQFECCFVHFAVAKSASTPALAQENIDAAYRHLVRASLDAAKLLWTTLHENAIKFVDDEDIRRFCSNATEGAVHSQYQKAQQASIEARRSELGNVGIAPEVSIEKWHAAALEYQALYKLIDMDKVRALRKRNFKATIKSHSVSFILGVLASTVVAWGWPTPPSTAMANTENKQDASISAQPTSKLPTPDNGKTLKSN